VIIHHEFAVFFATAERIKYISAKEKERILEVQRLENHTSMLDLNCHRHVKAANIRMPHCLDFLNYITFGDPNLSQRYVLNDLDCALTANGTGGEVYVAEADTADTRPSKAIVGISIWSPPGRTSYDT